MSANNTLTPGMMLREMIGAPIGTPRKYNTPMIGGAMTDNIKHIMTDPTYVFLIVMTVAMVIYKFKDGESWGNLSSGIICMLCATVPIVAAQCHSKKIATFTAVVIGLCCLCLLFGGDNVRSELSNHLKNVTSKIKSTTEQEQESKK
jgi:hypothetical protein